jgi:hypothetical protein
MRVFIVRQLYFGRMASPTGWVPGVKPGARSTSRRKRLLIPIQTQISMLVALRKIRIVTVDLPPYLLNFL